MNQVPKIKINRLRDLNRSTLNLILCSLDEKEANNQAYLTKLLGATLPFIKPALIELDKPEEEINGNREVEDFLNSPESDLLLRQLGNVRKISNKPI